MIKIKKGAETLIIDERTLIEHQKLGWTAIEYGVQLGLPNNELKLTVHDIKAKLDEMGIAYPPTAKKDDLIALLDEATKEPAE